MNRTTRGHRKRQSLFELYAANYAIHDPVTVQQHGKLFRCPICGLAFNEVAVAAQEVDIAHVYPRSSGGKQETLECSECNNRLGTTFDHHVTTYNKVIPAIGGSGGPVTGMLTVDGMTMAVDVTKNDGQIKITNIVGRGNPKAPFAFADGKKFTISLPSANHNRLNGAILHSAYLAMFRSFGYEYLFHADTEWIRTILVSPPSNQNQIPVVKRFVTHPEARAAAHTIGLAEVDAFKSFVATFPMPSGSGYDAIVVFMPGFGENGSKMYDQISQCREAMPLHFKWLSGNPETWLRLPEASWCGRFAWDEFCERGLKNL